MARQSGAGGRREKVTFDPPLETDDAHGGTETGWNEAAGITRWCQLVYKSGSEGLEAARPSGRAIYKLRVRSSAATRAITTDWRARIVRRGIEFNIREVDPLDPARRHVWIEVESGVAV